MPTNAISTKGCMNSMKRKRCVTSKWEANPVTKPTIIASWLKNKTIQFPPPFHICSYSNGPLPVDASVGQLQKERLVFCEWASEWLRGVYVHIHAWFLSLACHPAEIDGEKCPNEEETCLTFIWPRQKTCCLEKSKTTLTSLGRGSWVCGWT